MKNARQEWQIVKKVQKLIHGKQFRGNTLNLPGSGNAKLTLMVDMDETLIHSEEFRPGVKYDEVVSIRNP